MTLSFAERRAQAQTLGNISFWLNPQSRSFDSLDLTMESLEELCGPIQGIRFDATLADNVLNSAFHMAEGLLVEYAFIRNCKLSEFKPSADYSLVSRLPHGDPGKELGLTLTVLQSIINGNDAISSRAETTSRLEILMAAKADLDKEKPDAPEFLSVDQRIDNCDEISDQEIEEFIDQIEKDNSYQNHIPSFARSLYLLKGLKHLKFLQNAFASVSTINKSFFDTVTNLTESLVSQLSEEELEKAFTESTIHFNLIKDRKRDFLTEFKKAIACKKSGLVFTCRLLLLGPDKVCDELCAFLSERTKGEDGKYHDYYTDSNIKNNCVAMLSDLPSLVYKMMFEGDRPYLLMHLFKIKSPFFHTGFQIPLDVLILSGVLPLHKLLKTMLKTGAGMRQHFWQLLNSPKIVHCVREAVSSEDLEVTTQALIDCMAIVACPEVSAKGTPVRDVLNQLKRKSGAKDSEWLVEWLAKYENGQKVSDWVGLGKKKEKKTDESIDVPAFDTLEWVTGNDEQVKEDEIQKGGEKTEEEVEMKKEDEDETQSEDEGGETEKEAADGMEKEDTAETAQEENEHTDQASKVLADDLNVAKNVASAVVEEIMDQFAVENLGDDSVAKEGEADSEKEVPQVDGAVTEEEDLSTEQVRQDLPDDAGVVEDDAAIDQADLSAAPIADAGEIPPYPQEGLLPFEEEVADEEAELEEEGGNERLADSQSSTHSQEGDGFAKSINDIDTIGGI